jgi:hypothetical protein
LQPPGQPVSQPAPPKTDTSAPLAPPTAADQKKTSEAAELAEPLPAPSENGDSWTPQEASDAWQQIITQIEDLTGDYARKAESIATSGPNRLVARFRKAYTHFKDQLERPERRQQLEKLLQEAVGRPIRVEFEIVPDAPEAAAAAPKPQPTAARRRQRIKEVERNLLVQQAIAVFDAEILDVIDPPPSDEADTPDAAPPESANPDP